MGTEPNQYLAIATSQLRLQSLSLSQNSTIDTNGTKWSDVTITIMIAVWKRGIMPVEWDSYFYWILPEYKGTRLDH